jgi:hypothetical protein
MTKNNGITNRLIKGVLGLGLVAGALSAATGCDESDMRLLGALGNVVSNGLDQQGGSATSQQPGTDKSGSSQGMSGSGSGSYNYSGSGSWSW